MGKRPAESVDQIDNAKIVHEAEKPKKLPRPPPQNHYATSDAVVLELSTRTVLQNAMLWDYATHASSSYGRDVLEAALTPLEDLNYNTTGEARKQSVPGMITTFWELHSKYIAPNGTQVRGMYKDVLDHVTSLYQQYGDDFMESGSKQEQAFVRCLAEESVPPDESEAVGDNGVLERLQVFLKQTSFVMLLDHWLTNWANLPVGEDAESVNMDLNANVYFKPNGVLGIAIRLISEFIERLRHPPNAPQDNSDNLRQFVDWQMKYSGQFTYFPSCILLGVPCVIAPQSVTQLQPSFWENNGIQLILKQMSKEQKHPAADTISALFIYSGIDPSNGIDAMLELMSSALHGSDKATDGLDSQYTQVLTEHTRMRGPPWRTKNTAWPDGAVMENSNYAYAKMLIDLAAVPTRAIVEESMPAGGEKRAATVLETEKLVPPTSKRQKVTEKPKEEETVEIEEGTNLPLIGGILAITAGIGAVYMSRRGRRK